MSKKTIENILEEMIDLANRLHIVSSSIAQEEKDELNKIGADIIKLKIKYVKK